ncbi:hypothetical protein JNUCC64_15005 [Streptomyces sp. JNUCC 64]
MTTTPDPGSDDVTEADRRFRVWMRQNLDRAAARFGLTVTGEPVFGWRDRSISAPAHSPDGARWLRVASELTQWAHGPGSATTPTSPNPSTNTHDDSCATSPHDSLGTPSQLLVRSDERAVAAGEVLDAG